RAEGGSRRAGGRPRGGRQGDLRAKRLRGLPYHSRRLGRAARPRSHDVRQPPHAGGRALADHRRHRRRVAQGSVDPEAGREDARARPHGRAGACDRDLPDRPQVMSAHPTGRVLHAPTAALPGAGTMATVLGWLTTVDHKRIGILYGVSGFAFFLLGGTPPDVGWFGYANLTSKHFAPGLGVDFWILSLQILGVSSVIAAINFIVTILNMRAPGMTMMRMPVFVWMTLVVQFLIALA